MIFEKLTTYLYKSKPPLEFAKAKFYNLTIYKKNDLCNTITLYEYTYIST